MASVSGIAKAFATYGRGKFWIPFFACISICAICATVLLYPRCAEAYGPYKATVVRVYDGDTVKMLLQVYPGLIATTMVRIRGIQAPEIRTRRDCEKQAGYASKDHLASLVDSKSVYEVVDLEEGRYPGRVIADIMIGDQRVSEIILRAGHAIPYDGVGRAPSYSCQ